MGGRHKMAAELSEEHKAGVEAVKTAQAAKDYEGIARAGYAAFGVGNIVALEQYFHADTVFQVMFPVPGWETQKGYPATLQQFGGLQTDANPGVEGFTAKVDSVDTCGQKVFVHEHIATKRCPEGFKALATHHYDGDGKCTLIEVYQDSVKMSPPAPAGEGFSRMC